MAPTTKGTKRAAAAPASGKARKAAKASQQEEQLQQVTRAIEGVNGLPEGCRSMLIALMPSLSTPKDARHALQQHAAGLIGSTMDQARSEKEAVAAAAAARAAEVDAKRAELQSKQDGAQGILEQKTKASNEKKEALDAAGKLVDAAKGALHAAREAEGSSKKAREAKAQECDAFAALLSEHLQPIKEGSWDEGSPAGQKHLDSLDPALRQAELDPSVMASLRISGSKRGPDRTSFDSMVLEQVTTSLSEKATKLGAELSDKAPAVAECEAAVAAKQSELQVAETKFQESDGAFSEAKSEQAQSEAAHKAAAQALEAFKAESKDVLTTRELAQAELELFIQGPLAAFGALRDAASKSSETVAESGAAEEVATVAASGGA